LQELHQPIRRPVARHRCSGWLEPVKGAFLHGEISLDLLLDQITGSLGSVTADGAYEQDRVYAEVANCGDRAAAPRSRRRSGDGNGRLVKGDGASERGRTHVWTNVGRAKSTLVGVLNRMLELGSPNYVHIFDPKRGCIVAYTPLTSAPR
jgi:hypothetical protein